jgi:hypothetical protein
MPGGLRSGGAAIRESDHSLCERGALDSAVGQHCETVTVVWRLEQCKQCVFAGYLLVAQVDGL